MVRILIVAGGTGGHIYPGIAVAKSLAAEGNEIWFILRPQDKCETISVQGFKYETISFYGLPRRINLRWFLFWLYLFKAMVKSFYLIYKLNPRLVIGMGGYLSVPVLFTAKLFGKRTIIQEQNIVPGLANRVLSYFVDGIATGFPQTRFPIKVRNKVVHTGNPVRPNIQLNYPQTARTKLKLSPDKFTVLVFGGSLGAHQLNLLVTHTLPLISPELQQRIQFIHLTGEKDCPEVKIVYSRYPIIHYIASYDYQMETVYSAADLVVCRAGASTISELIKTQKPAILIPYPYATDNHQEHNARYLTELGCTLLYREKEVNSQIFIDTITRLYNSPETIKQMQGNYSQIPQKDSTREIVTLINNLFKLK